MRELALLLAGTCAGLAAGTCCAAPFLVIVLSLLHQASTRAESRTRNAEQERRLRMN